MPAYRSLAPSTLTLTAMLALASPAMGAPPPGQATEAAITQVYDQGLEAVQREQWDKALEAFQTTWKARKTYQVAAKLGLAYLKVGAYRNAAEHLAFFLRQAPPEVSADDRAKAQAMLMEAKSKIGTIALRVTPDGADVLLNGLLVEFVPGQHFYVDPGPQVVVVVREGYESARYELELGAGEGKTLEVRLVPDPQQAPKLPPASPPAPEPEPEEGRNRTVIGVGLGMSAAAAVAGGVLLAIAASKTSQRDQICDPAHLQDCSRAQGDDGRWIELERQRTMHLNAGLWTFIGAGAIGATTLVYALTGFGPTLNTQRLGKVQVHPMGAGMAVTGQW